LCKGKADYKPIKGFENRQHVIGDGDNPILILKKGDVPKLFNDLFYFVYGLWDLFHHGKGIVNLEKLDPDIMDSILAMEKHFENNFSMGFVQVKYLEALLRKRTL